MRLLKESRGGRYSKRIKKLKEKELQFMMVAIAHFEQKLVLKSFKVLKYFTIKFQNL